jgi:hypothetical protein
MLIVMLSCCCGSEIAETRPRKYRKIRHVERWMCIPTDRNVLKMSFIGDDVLTIGGKEG